VTPDIPTDNADHTCTHAYSPVGMTDSPGAMSVPSDMYLIGDLYLQVIPEKRTSVGAAMMGSAHTYDLGGGKGMSAEGVEVSLSIHWYSLR